MITIIGVRFRNVGKVYYFSPRELDICVGDHVIVETARGVEYGFVVLGPKEVDDSKVIQPLKEVIRIATPKDDAREESNRKKEKEAFEICQKKIRAHNLEMKLIDAEYTFDNNKMLFYFTADGRIDFRELVKDLAAVFKTRIELRQIGVRDETKIVGGIGICGRPLCCASYLSEFIPVSIKMAKEQGLSLNPTKISGTCGRLMCCLKHEQYAYEQLLKVTPRAGAMVQLPDGTQGVVEEVFLLTGKLRVRPEGAEVGTLVSKDEVQVLHATEGSREQRPPRKKPQPAQNSAPKEQKPQKEAKPRRDSRSPRQRSDRPHPPRQGRQNKPPKAE